MIDGSMRYTYYTQGTCSSQIDFEIDDNGIIGDVAFTGGCHGNLQDIAVLLCGMKATDAVAKLRGIRCGYKNTSCPDQMAQALTRVLEKK